MARGATHIAACPPPEARGLSREQSAAYVGIGTSLFDRMVQDGRMPRPKHMNSRTVWDRLALDRAFDALPSDAADAESPSNAWD